MMKKKFLTTSLVAVLALVLGLTSTFTSGNSEIYAATAANRNYSLAGAEYQLYTDAACQTPAKTASGGNAILTTDAEGNTGEIEIEVGTYYAKETKASPGYLRDTKTHNFTVSLNQTASFESKEPPTIGRLPKLIKYDKTGKEGWKKLIGAEYTVKYYDVTPGTEDLSSETPLKTWTFKTVHKIDAQGHDCAGIDFEKDTPLEGSDSFYEAKVTAYDSNNEELNPSARTFDENFHHYRLDNNGEMTRVLPLGVITVEETKAPSGLQKNETTYYADIQQPGEGLDATTDLRNTDEFYFNASTGKMENAEKPQNVEIHIEKVVGQTGTNVPQASESTAPSTRKAEYTTLAGAVFNVYSDDSELGAPELVGTITTDEEGKASLTKREKGDSRFIGDDLLPGYYIIEEVSAPKGFLLDKFVLTEDGKTEEFEGDLEGTADYKDGDTSVHKTVKSEYENGRQRVFARAQVEETHTFKYTLKSNDYGTETHIKKTDAVTSEEIEGAKLQIIDLNQGDNYGTVVEEWISEKDKEHVIYELNPGNYLLREITAPYGYDVAEDVEFTVSDTEIINKVEMKNKPVTVGTTAIDDATKTHHGIKSEETKLTDTVHVTGLYEGRKYKIEGILMDQSTGEPYKDAEDQTITGSSDEFTADAEEMDVEVNFTFDSSKFDDDTTLVVYEKLYRTAAVVPKDGHPARPAEELPVELNKHEKLDDEAQTVRFGGIASTTALDKKSKGHNMLGEKDAVIVDTVKYENLSPLEEYTVEGELYDKTTGKLTGIKASAKFKPEKSDGSVEVEFKFDASAFKGHKLVAYETLLVNKVVVDKHEDPDDEEQTVNVPEVKTEAVNPECNDHIANAGPITIKDTITYKGVTAGKTYTAKGTLQYRSGLFGQLKTVMKDGQPLTATTTFKAEKENGTAEVTFTFDAVDLAGKTVVVFEDLYDGEFVVATHADIDDADQSVHIPEVGTKVGKKQGKFVIDVVKYKNLIPNKTYVARGWFVNKKDGSKVPGSEAEVEFVPQTADGKIEVKLKPGSGKGAKVAFEEIYIRDASGKEVLVGEHKDIKDKAQTYSPAPKTGDSYKLYLIGTSFLLAVALAMILTIIRRKKMTCR